MADDFNPSPRQRELLRLVFTLGVAREVMQTWTRWETLEGPKHFASPAQARTWLDARVAALIEDVVKSEDADVFMRGGSPMTFAASCKTMIAEVAGTPEDDPDTKGET